MHNRLTGITSAVCLYAMFAVAPAAGQTVFLVLEGEPPVPGTDIIATGGDVLNLEVWVDDIPSQSALREWRVKLPCQADDSSATAGSVDYDGNAPNVDDTHPDYVFSGLTETTTASSSGNCPSSNTAEFPFALRGVDLGDGVTPTSPKYLATFTYTISTDASGKFQLTPVAGACLGADSYLREDLKGTICFSDVDYETLIIKVPAGRCCIDQGCFQDCQEQTTEFACDAAGGVFTANEDCTAGCPCQTGSHCDDGDACTRDVCTDGTCSNPSGVRYGDVFPCGGNNFVNIDDILAVIEAFGGNYFCPVCDGSGGECGAQMAMPITPGGEDASARYALQHAGPAQGAQGVYRVDVFANDLADFNTYSLMLEVAGGEAGALELASVHADQKHPDFVFAGEGGHVLYVDEVAGRIDAALLRGTLSKPGPVYLGTFNFRPTSQAKGQFQLELHTVNEPGLTATSQRSAEARPAASAVLDVR